ncbi:MAG: TatD family hydrolase, partial [Synergistaceae bacterium]|nr:TatD family hydrolase [Synergistaceae bacterium]
MRKDAQEIIRRADEANVKKLIIVGCDLDDSLEAVELAHKFSLPPNSYFLTPTCYASIGIHPHEVKRYETIPEEFYKLVKDEK